MPAPTKIFTVLSDSDVDPESPVTTALMTALRDNDIHLEEWLGFSFTAAQDHDHDGVNSKPVVGVADGAITETKLASAAVSQAKLKTTTGDVTTVSTTFVNLTLPGGEYGFYPNTGPDANVTQESRIGVGGITGLRANIALLDSGGFNARARQRYVQASPPYESYRPNDPVPLFMFALVNNTTGAIVATYVAPDPPWANNGPTPINPLARLQALKRRRMAISFADVRAGSASMAQYEAELLKPSPVSPDEIATILREEIPQAEKNADMALIPHPFPSPPAGHTIVVLEPRDSQRGRAFATAHEREEPIAEMLHGGYLIVDNQPLTNLITPAGVMAVAARLK